MISEQPFFFLGGLMVILPPKNGNFLIVPYSCIAKLTLPETNIAPEDGWLEYYLPFGMAYFQGRLLLVSGRVECIVSLNHTYPGPH